MQEPTQLMLAAATLALAGCEGDGLDSVTIGVMVVAGTILTAFIYTWWATYHRDL